MTDFQVAAILISLTAGLAYVNARVLRLPSAIGLMATALLGSLIVLTLDKLGITAVAPRVAALLEHVNLSYVLLHAMLGVLLFAGALHIDLSELRALTLPVAILSVVATALSTLFVGGAAYVVLDAIGLPLPFVQCLLFGALISPTDPIAVLGILRHAGTPKPVEVTITGESLFNDGIGVVFFLAVLGAVDGGGFDAGAMARAFIQEAIGGALFGIAIGYVAFRMVRSIDQCSVEILITLAMVLGGYTLAEALHVSAPIAAVTAGLLIGNHGRTLAMSETTRDHLDTFWELIDEILNAVLFLLIGLELIRLELSAALMAAAAVIVPLVLASRLVSVSLPLLLMPGYRRSVPGVISLLTWGGLRGGISVALALSLPPGRERDVILAITYGVVVISILVQGTTVGWLARRLAQRRAAEPVEG